MHRELIEPSDVVQVYAHPFRNLMLMNNIIIPRLWQNHELLARRQSVNVNDFISPIKTNQANNSIAVEWN